MNLKLLNLMVAVAFLLFPTTLSAQKVISEYNPEALYDEGLMLFNNKHYGAAIEAFERFRSEVDNKKSQQAVSALYYEAVSSLYLNKAEGASKILAFVNDNPGSSWAEQANFLYANLLMREKEYNEAIAIYEVTDASSLGELEAQELQFNLAYSYFQIGQSDKALPLLKLAIEEQSLFRDQAVYYYAHIKYVMGEDAEALQYFSLLRENPTYNKIVPVYELQMKYRKGECNYVIDEGAAVIDKVEKKRKGEIANLIADCCFQQGQYAKANEYYNIYQQNRRRAVPRGTQFQIAISLLKTNDIDHAIENLLRIANLGDSIGQYSYYYLADCYTQKDQKKFARTAFLNAYKAGFDSIIAEDALFNYVKLSFIPGVDPFNEAYAVLNEYIINNPQSDRKQEAEELIIHLLLNAKDYDAALQKLGENNNLSSEMKQLFNNLMFSIATESYANSDYSQAKKYFKRVYDDLNSDRRAEACFWLGEANYRTNNKSDAQHYFQTFLAMPESKNTTLYSLAFYNLAYLYYLSDNYADAVTEFEKYVAQLDKTDVLENDAMLRIGDSYFIQREYGKAATAYAKAAKMNTKSADYALYQQGLCYGAQGNTDQKVEMLQILVSNYPNSKYYDKALYEMGSTYLVLKDQRSAINIFERLIYERPRSSYTRQAMMKIGMMYYNNDQNEQAIEKLKQVVQGYKNTDESREAMNLIKSIYMNQNRIQDYFEFAATVEGQQINITEQDSLAFLTAETFYQESHFSQALTALETYFENYPNGAYQLKAHHYAIYCLEKLNRNNELYSHLLYIVNQDNNDYTDQALMKLARIEYDNKHYDSATVYYERLQEVTEFPLLRIEALEGRMKSRYFIADYDNSIKLALQLRAQSDLTTEQINHISYILGKSYFEKQQYANAKIELDLCATHDNTVYGAESAYLSIVADYNLGKYAEAENKVFRMSETFASHNYWVAKAFIVLSDVYVAQSNYFQAKETLRSIIDNYQGADLKKLAQQKYDAIKDIEPAEEYEEVEVEEYETAE